MGNGSYSAVSSVPNSTRIGKEKRKNSQEADRKAIFIIHSAYVLAGETE
jgi:hypothetical protein